MRISDCSSDVCSSDLLPRSEPRSGHNRNPGPFRAFGWRSIAKEKPVRPFYKGLTGLRANRNNGEGGIRTQGDPEATPDFETGSFSRSYPSPEIGNAPCRERVSHDVEIWVVGGT